MTHRFQSFFWVLIQSFLGASSAVAMVVPKLSVDPLLMAPACVVNVDEVVKPLSPSVQDFIEFVAPMAMTLQKETGLPASYLIAQAGIESGWGRSRGYNVRNSLFGYSCGRGRGALQPMSFVTRLGRAVQVNAHCVSPRPEGGHYYSFDSMMDGFWAQAYLLLHSVEGARLTALRQLLARTPVTASANARDVILRIRGYAASMSSERYQGYLLGAIEQFGLSVYDTLCF